MTQIRERGVRIRAPPLQRRGSERRAVQVEVIRSVAGRSNPFCLWYPLHPITYFFSSTEQIVVKLHFLRILSVFLLLNPGCGDDQRCDFPLFLSRVCLLQLPVC